jgi:hypothetical protein
MEDSRKQFEEAFEQLKHDRFGSNEEWAWKFWQASRAAIEIELPTTTEGFGMYSQEVAQVAIDLCAGQIEASGLKIKE